MSLWTIFFEILCYMVVAGLALIGVLRRRDMMLALTVAVWGNLALVVSLPKLNQQFSLLHWLNTMNFLTLLPLFLVGSLLYLYRDIVPDSGILAMACAGIFVISLWLPIGTSVPAARLTSANLFAPVLAYPFLWLGLHLPFQSVGTRNDYSYGMYLYAFPVQQFLVTTWHVERHGYVTLLALSVFGTAPFAVASWWLIEKRALALKKIGLPRFAGAGFVWVAESWAAHGGESIRDRVKRNEAGYTP